MAKLRMVHASTHGARKPPGPIKFRGGGDRLPGCGGLIEMFHITLIERS